jgi:hypothetical protein
MRTSSDTHRPRLAAWFATLHAGADRAARRRGWSITVVGRWSSTRVYRDDRYDGLAVVRAAGCRHLPACLTDACSAHANLHHVEEART